MKRVHNDPGPSKSSASGSPPPSNGPPKGKKRKANIITDGPFIEKALKRVATPPIMAAQPQEPSLIDRYLQSEKRLQETVQRLHDPRDPNNMEFLRSAGDCIKVMAQTMKRINDAPEMGHPFG